MLLEGAGDEAGVPQAVTFGGRGQTVRGWQGWVKEGLQTSVSFPLTPLVSTNDAKSDSNFTALWAERAHASGTCVRLTPDPCQHSQG